MQGCSCAGRGPAAAAKPEAPPLPCRAAAQAPPRGPLERTRPARRAPDASPVLTLVLPLDLGRDGGRGAAAAEDVARRGEPVPGAGAGEGRLPGRHQESLQVGPRFSAGRHVKPLRALFAAAVARSVRPLPRCIDRPLVPGEPLHVPLDAAILSTTSPPALLCLPLPRLKKSRSAHRS